MSVLFDGSGYSGGRIGTDLFLIKVEHGGEVMKKRNRLYKRDKKSLMVLTAVQPTYYCCWRPTEPKYESFANNINYSWAVINKQ